ARGDRQNPRDSGFSCSVRPPRGQARLAESSRSGGCSDAMARDHVIAAVGGAAVGGLIVSLLTVLLRSRFDHESKVRSESGAERRALYRKLVDAVKSRRPPLNLDRLAVDVVLFGSDEVVRVWSTFVDPATPRNSNDAWGKMLLAIRR